MINIYTGTPGSGKSLRTSLIIYNRLRHGSGVIANFAINMDVVEKRRFSKKKKKVGRFDYCANKDLTVHYLVEHSKKYHKPNKENQTLLVIDESQILFNTRTANGKDRMNWITFFSQHRKLGYEVILVAQQDRMLDRQIRSLIENETRFRKVNNYGFLKVIPFSLFVAVNKWYGINAKTGSDFFLYSKKLGNLYDTYSLFE